MQKSTLLITSVLIGGLFLGGCQHVKTATDSTVGMISKGINAYDGWIGQGNVRVYDEMANHAIRDKFLSLKKESENYSAIRLNQVLLDDKYKLEKRTFTAIYLEKYVTHQANFGEANRQIDRGIYVSEKDLAAKLFIEQALAQGHEVRMYKKNVNAAINEGLAQAITAFNGASNRYNVDPAFIEFDKQGQPVALMTRSWQTISAIGVDSRIYTNIYFGTDTLRWFENNFSNRFLEDNLIRVHK